MNIDGDKLNFSDIGTGKPVIFIHGGCGSGKQWKALSTALSEKYRCIALDLFGNGESEPWPIERIWTVDDDQRAIDAILEYVGEPVHFIIHSGGGHYAYPSIKNSSSQIMSITLFEPIYFHLLHQSGDPLFAEIEEMANRYRHAMDVGNRETAMAGFVDAWAGAEGAWEKFPEPVKAAMRVGSDRLYHEWACLWLDKPSRSDLQALDRPVLLFKGTNTTRSMSRVCDVVQQALPHCKYVELDGAGHMGPFTHAEAVLPFVKQHLAMSEIQNS